MKINPQWLNKKEKSGANKLSIFLNKKRNVPTNITLRQPAHDMHLSYNSKKKYCWQQKLKKQTKTNTLLLWQNDDLVWNFVFNTDCRTEVNPLEKVYPIVPRTYPHSIIALKSLNIFHIALVVEPKLTDFIINDL